MKTNAQPWGRRAAFSTVACAIIAAAGISAGQDTGLPSIPAVPNPTMQPIAPVQSVGLQPIAAAPVFYPPPGQGLGPAAPCPICAVDGSCCRVCGPHGCDRQPCWDDARFIAWQAYAQGEYVGHARTAHVPEYRLRVDDQLDMLYRITRDETRGPYKLNVGDGVRVESFTDPDLNRELIVQPDGMITVRLLGQIHAAGSTVTQLRDVLEDHYKKYYKVPSITVTPIKVNTQLDDLRNVVDRRYGPGGGQGSFVRVAPDGTISLTAIGYVRAQGLTLDELRQEINERYRERIEGMEIIPVLSARAPRYCYVLGEVRTPGRFEMVGPTTAMQAIAMAGSWNVGANLVQTIVFRRGDDWRLMATRINLEGALYGRRPAPPGEIWLSDGDVIVVPKGPILQIDDYINLLFTRGVYGVFPLYPTINFNKLATI